MPEPVFVLPDDRGLYRNSAGWFQVVLRDGEWTLTAPVGIELPLLKSVAVRSMRENNLAAPKHRREINAYKETATEPSVFVRAILENDLRAALSAAKSEDMEELVGLTLDYALRNVAADYIGSTQKVYERLKLSR